MPPGSSGSSTSFGSGRPVLTVVRAGQVPSQEAADVRPSSLTSSARARPPPGEPEDGRTVPGFCSCRPALYPTRAGLVILFLARRQQREVSQRAGVFRLRALK
jgi:hypothetical protein